MTEGGVEDDARHVHAAQVRLDEARVGEVGVGDVGLAPLLVDKGDDFRRLQLS